MKQIQTSYHDQDPLMEIQGWFVIAYCHTARRTGPQRPQRGSMMSKTENGNSKPESSLKHVMGIHNASTQPLVAAHRAGQCAPLALEGGRVDRRRRRQPLNRRLVSPRTCTSAG
jgi:hypothetical protein